MFREVLLKFQSPSIRLTWVTVWVSLNLPKRVSQSGRESVSHIHSYWSQTQTKMRLIAEVSASEVLVVFTIKIVEMAKSEVNSLRMSNNFCGFWRFHLNTSRNYLFFLSCIFKLSKNRLNISKVVLQSNVLNFLPSFLLLMARCSGYICEILGFCSFVNTDNLSWSDLTKDEAIGRIPMGIKTAFISQMIPE